MKRTELTMKQFEEIVKLNKRNFAATSEDSYAMSVDVVDAAITFDKVTDKDEYLSMSLCDGGTEIQMSTDIIDAVYQESDTLFRIEFNNGLPALDMSMSD